jgi:antitoxin component of MazEF toxin-antitoxin module
MDMKLQKIGNSHMVTIPAKLIRRSGLRIGQPLHVSLHEETIEITPQKKSKKINIADMKMKTVSIPLFNFEESMKWRKAARYDR